MKKPIDIKDHFLTQEYFNLKENAEGILQTHPKPKPEQVDKYYKSQKYISHTDNTNSLMDRVYQCVKKQNNRNKKRVIKKYKSSGNLLDYGCGVGDFLAGLGDDFYSVGVEPNINASKIAERKTGSKIITTPDLSGFEDHFFDVITLWHVFEHVYDLQKTSSQLKRILAQNGLLAIAVPNHKSYDALHYKSFWAAYDVPRHLWHFSKRSMSKWWEKFDMEVKEIIPMKWDAFYVSILSEKYKNKNIFSLGKGIYYGFLSNQKAKKTGEYSSLIYLLNKKS